MLPEKKVFYSASPGGDTLLTEIYQNGHSVIIIIGDKRIDLDMNSAFDLADAIIDTANEARHDFESY
tara:strand:- start:434 stop:634 length:201 start_codon:yes stop_codon:yes gene_type:complete